MLGRGTGDVNSEGPDDADPQIGAGSLPGRGRLGRDGGHRSVAALRVPPHPAASSARTRPSAAAVRISEKGPCAVRRASYCLRYGLPSAAGGIVRPMTPATAISVKT